jgi:CheY-like chemotaxis protein
MTRMCKLLIIDNEKDILGVLKNILSTRGFDVNTLSSGNELQQHVSALSPDIILLDINLDNYDGRKICIDLKNEASTRHIQVILCSANRETKENVMKYQADGFIEKPFDIHDLIQVLQEHCN